MLRSVIYLFIYFERTLKYNHFREWVEDNQLYIQQVSSAVSTRADVIHLEELLDTKIQQRQARETGICPIRRELYSQCFGKERPPGGGGVAILHRSDAL